MKKLLLLLLLCPLLTFAQNDTTKVKTVQKYREVIAWPRALASGMRMSIDFGKDQDSYNDDERKEAAIVDNFRSMTEALNYMDKQGWEFVTAYLIPATTYNSYILHYIFRRKL